MKQKIKKILLWVLPCLVMVVIVGCITYTNPQTGVKTYALDPNNGLVKCVDWIFTTEQSAAPVLISLSAVWPPLALIIGILGGLGSMWAGLKPKVTQAQSATDQLSTVLTGIVHGIENYKETNPDGWLKLETEFTNIFGPKATAVITAIRNSLPDVPVKTS